MKILIDSVYVNDGGGKILLDLLIERIIKDKKEVDFLFDNRYENKLVKSKLPFFNNFFKRYYFYFNNNKYDVIFTFGNLPPLVRGKKNITYFHQPLFVNDNSSSTIKTKILTYFKKKYIQFYSKNTDIWVVQTENIKSKLQKTFKINASILKHPFYRELQFEKLDKKNSFLYPSKAYPHKNHEILINGFCDFYDISKNGELIITVESENLKISSLIAAKKKLGYPIKNIGFVNQEQLRREYLKAKFVIFPSENESFGLGLIEAVMMKCKLIAPELEYVKDIVNPSITIKSLTIEGITTALIEASKGNIKDSGLLAKNDLNQILKLIYGEI